MRDVWLCGDTDQELAGDRDDSISRSVKVKLHYAY